MCLEGFDRDNLSEWLRRQTRNLLGFARASSNPAVVDFLSIHFSILFYCLLFHLLSFLFPVLPILLPDLLPFSIFVLFIKQFI